MNGNKINAILLYLLALFGLVIGGMIVRITDLGPFNLGFYRLLTASIVLLPWGIKYYHSYTKREKAICLLSGVFFAFSVVLWNVAAITTTISSAGPIVNMWVLFLYH